MYELINDFKYGNVPLKDVFKEVETNLEGDKLTVNLSHNKRSFEQDALEEQLKAFISLFDPKVNEIEVNFSHTDEHENEMNSILNKDDILYLFVSSGKGGVGKSSVSSNLAVAFKDKGYKVALIDCDIYGSSIPNIFKIEELPDIQGNILTAAHVDGMDVVSVDFILDTSKAIIWRGPMLNKALSHFFYYTKYSPGINVVIVDLPPGTGDVPLDLAKLIPQGKQIVVTTPDLNAAAIAIKAGEMAKQMKHELVGVVENMSYYEHNGEKLPVFGTGGGEEVADKLGVPLLSQIEISKPRNGSFYEKDEPNYQIYSQLVDSITKATNLPK